MCVLLANHDGSDLSIVRLSHLWPLYLAQSLADRLDGF